MGQTCGSTNCRIPVIFVIMGFAVALSASCANSTSVNAEADDAAGVPAAGGSGGFGGKGTATQYTQDAASATGCLVSSGQVVPVGTVYGTGFSCCVCTGAESGTCAATDLQPRDGGATFCQSRDDCAALRQADCIFDPGCSPPQGICTEYILSPVGLPGANAVLDYCGCDGQTFHIDAYPDRPYSHLGVCP
jgi:hypothetical protein